MINVALCFYGQPRYVNNKEVPQSYVKYFDRPEYNVVTFGHCWFSQDAVYSSSSWTQLHEDYKVDPDTISKLIGYYNFDRLVVEKPKAFRFHNEEFREKYRQVQHHINFTDHRENNTLSQLFSIEMVSRTAPDGFDYYVLCRYDTVITGIPDLTQADPEKLYLPNCGDFSDIVIVVPQKFLSWPRQIYTIAQNKHLPIGGFMPEEFKKYSFYECGFDRSQTIDWPMFGHIARTE